MFSFFNKKNTEKFLDNDDFKKITESLYKQNFEIAQKNKTLSILNRLYEISLLAPNLNDLSNKVCLLIQSELDFDLVGTFVFNEKGNKMLPVAVSVSERLKKIVLKYDFDFYSLKVDKILKTSFLGSMVNDKDVKYTSNISDVFGKRANAKFVSELKGVGHIKTIIAYPIIINNKTIGIFAIGINRKYPELADYEKESLKIFANVISSLIDKALLYQELKITNQKLEEANTGQKNLIYIMNHQIKGYLTVSKNIFAELLTDDYGRVPEDAKDIITKGLENSDKGQKYVTDILKGTSVENGTLSYDMKKIDFREIILKETKNQEKSIENKKLKLSINIPNENYDMIGDSIQLGEVVRNLIENSIYYTPFGCISVGLKREGDKIVFSVKDTGVGVKDEDRDKIFKIGGVGNNSIKINASSSGYGLVFVKGVVEKHKGRVWFESEGEGKGTTFFVELPAK